MAKPKTRCSWAEGDPLMMDYHDLEWGTPVVKENLLFEFLTLEGAQAGLSWITILKKREHYQKVFSGFDPEKVARFDQRKIESLLKDPGIIRNRLKVESAVNNARIILKMRSEPVPFNKYIWSFVDYRPVQNHYKKLGDLPAATDISKAMSKDMKKRGFRFVGPTILYAFMQATGMVNDHVVTCFRHPQVKQSEKSDVDPLKKLFAG
jgi:DNA-3-methyladenine glycosylase I